MGGFFAFSTLKPKLKRGAQAGAVLMLFGYLVMNEDQRAAIAQTLRDPLSLLEARSPGDRQHAALRQTKIKHEVKLPLGSHLLSEGHVVPPEELANSPTFLAETDAPAPLPGDVPMPKGGGSTGGSSTPTIMNGGGGGGGSYGGTGGGSGGGGGGGGGGSGGGGKSCAENKVCVATPTGQPTPVVPVGEVPEPRTWAMMLCGFFLIGGLIRRTRAAGSAGMAVEQPLRRD